MNENRRRTRSLPQAGHASSICTEEVIERRLKKAIEELRQFENYDHLIVNRELEPAYATLRAIYLTRRYGVRDRADVPLPLAELAADVERNRASDPAAHARALVS